MCSLVVIVVMGLLHHVEALHVAGALQVRSRGVRRRLTARGASHAPHALPEVELIPASSKLHLPARAAAVAAAAASPSPPSPPGAGAGAGDDLGPQYAYMTPMFAAIRTRITK